jgi:hypothetical protein
MARRETLSHEQQAQVRAMIALLRDAVQLFGGPITYRLDPRLEKAHQRVAVAFNVLSAFDNDEEACKFWSETILGTSRECVSLAEVAPVPLLESKKNWTTAKQPVPYLAEATRNRAASEKEKRSGIWYYDSENTQGGPLL